MSELTVVGFQGIHRATQIPAQLRDLQAEGAITLQDAVAVYRMEDGELRVDQTVKVTSGEGGTVLRTALPPDEAKRLEQAIARPVPAPASVARPGRSA